jgi:hypothetical protein
MLEEACKKGSLKLRIQVKRRFEADQEQVMSRVGEDGRRKGKGGKNGAQK